MGVRVKLIKLGPPLPGLNFDLIINRTVKWQNLRPGPVRLNLDNTLVNEYQVTSMMLTKKTLYSPLQVLAITVFFFHFNTAMSADLEALKQADPELLVDAIYEITYQLEDSDQPAINDDVIHQLADLLSHPDENVRDSAAYAFELFADRRYVLAKPLMTNLLDRLKTKQTGANSIARVIGQLGGPVHISALAEVMDSSEPMLLQSLIAALGDIGHEQALPALFKTLKHENEDVRLSSVKAIAKIDHADAVKPLIEALSDSNDYVRSDAAIALGDLNDISAVEPLIALLKVDAYDDTIKALEKLGDARAIPVLINGLADNEFYDDTAVQAMQSLKKFNAEKEAFEGLVVIANNKNQDGLARITALGLIGKTENHQATKMLLALLLNKRESNLIRMYAAKSLGDLKDRKAIPTLTSLAFDGYRSKVPLMERIARFGSAEIADLLKEIRNDQDSDIIKEAVLALGKIGDSKSFKSLLLLLRDKDTNPQVRIKTIEALGFMGRKEAVEPLVTLLATLLKDDDKYTRQTIVKALAQINDDLAIPALISVLQKDNYEYARSDAAKALGNTSNRGAIPALLQSLNDSDSSVRRESRAALVKMTDASLVQQYIHALLNEGEETGYRTEMAEILANFNQPAVIDALLVFLKNKNWRIRIAAMQSLATLKEDRAVDEILAILSDGENEYVVANAVNALAEIGNPNAIPALIKASNDSDHISSAISALCTFKGDPRVAQVLADTSVGGPSAYIRKKTRCEPMRNILGSA